MLPLKTKCKLQWIFIMFFIIYFVEVINGQVTLTCTPQYPTFHESKDIANSVVNCTLTGGDTFNIKSQNPSSSFTYHQLDDPSMWGVYFMYPPDFESLSTYYVTLEGSQGSTLSNDVALTVNIIDDNDNKPYFNLNASTFSVDENTLYDSITDLVVTDADGSTDFDYTSVTFSLTGTNGDYGGTFGLSAVTLDDVKKEAVAQLTLVTELDYEKMVSYSLTVTATDGGGIATNFGIVVNVNDLEDTPPYFTQIATYTELPENSLIGEPVFTVVAVDGDLGIHHDVTYGITAGNDNGDFAIDTNTGVVTVQNLLDRDAGKSLYVLTIQATESDVTDTTVPYQSDTSATISLTDVNDCTPVFNNQSYNASVPEKSPAGFLVSFELDQTFVVSDKDTESFAAFDVTLDDPSKMFKISPTSGVSQQTFTILVEDPTSLDYETTPLVTATVTAVDRNDSTLSNTATITINILDVNDDDPVISSIDCTDTLENVAANTVICTVTASNPDPQFATLIYSGNFGQLDGKIDIDPTTGDIKVIVDGVFDYEYVKSYTFTVIATNNDGLGLSTSKNGILNILDVNDNNPSFQPDTYQVTLNEDEADFAVPLVVQASDLDSDVNAVLTFSIIQGNQYFALGSSSPSGKMYSQTIVPVAPLDFESMTDCPSPCPITVIVQATDGGTPALTGLANVTVQLMDTNDVIPVFDEEGYTHSVSEDATAGTSLLTVHASDGDATAKYNTVTYRLENDGAANFVIDQITGEITVSSTARLDPNIYSPVKYSYSLTVYANDGAHEPSCKVNITIIDVDNKAPQFDYNGVFNAEFSENDTTYIDTPFASVNASDEDQNPLLVYTIDFTKSTAKDDMGKLVIVDLSTYFTIDGETGDLYIVQAVDREIFDTASLALVVTDQNTEEGVATDTGSTFIQIDDVDDCPPVFKDAPYEGKVAEKSTTTIVQMSPSGTSIVANDDDRDFNQVTYTLIDNTDNFEIGSTTGIISTTTSANLDHETTKWVIVTIEAADNGVPPLTTTTTINITINDVNDNPPIFVSSYDFEIDEEEKNVVVGTVYATDEDDGDYGKVCYSIDYSKNPDYADLFTMGQDSGNITLNQPIDFDTTDTTVYVLQIVAKDNCQDPTNSLTDQSQATVTILPVNEFDPVISPIDPCPSVAEDAPVGTAIVTVTATDEDKSPDGAPFSYALEDASGHFKIDATSGDVSLNDDITDQVGTFDVTVTVCDASPNSRCSSEPFCINVTDVNNHSPIITNTDLGYDVEAWNCTEIGDYEFTVQYSDEDAYPQNQISEFSMTSTCTDAVDPDENEAFNIDPKSGDITIGKNLSMSTCTQYQLDVTVRNKNDISKFSSQQFIMSITGCIYTNAPPIFNGTRNEDVTWLESCTSACTPHQYSQPVELDLDEQDIPIYCYITDGNIDETFAINSNSCEISIAEGKSLDFEAIPYYQLTIFASEEGDPEETIPFDTLNRSLAVLNVIVGDVNDQPPYFNPSPFYAGVSSTNVFGTVFATLTAFDNDTVDPASALTYKVNGDITINNIHKMDDVPTDCITVNSVGNITLNYAFTDSMTGYIQFVADVTDSDGKHTNSTDVKIYVVSSNEKLLCLAMYTTAEFTDIYRGFESEFSNATGHNVVVDSIGPHTDAQDNVISTQCEVIVHMADSQNNILTADEAMQVVTDHSDVVYTVVFNEYKIFQIAPLLQTPVAADKNVLDIVLVAVAAVLLVLSIGLIIMSIYNSRRMKRKLKAATAPAFVSQNSGINRIGVPNSNLHAIEGSNPIWNQKANVEEELNFDETSDNVSIANSLGDVRNDEKFEGGLNNPTFEQRIENFFNEDNYRNSDAKNSDSEKFDFGDDEPDYQDRNSMRSDRDSIGRHEDRNSIRSDRDSIIRPLDELMDL